MSRLEDVRFESCALREGWKSRGEFLNLQCVVMCSRREVVGYIRRQSLHLDRFE